MRFFCLNAFGEPVFEMPDKTRAVFGEERLLVLENPAEPGRFLRATDDPSLWLCALAFAKQPPSKARLPSLFWRFCAGERFAEKDFSAAFALFSCCALTRFHLPLIDQALARSEPSPEFINAWNLLQIPSLVQALSGPLRAYFDPEAICFLRRSFFSSSAPAAAAEHPALCCFFEQAPKPCFYPEGMAFFPTSLCPDPPQPSSSAPEDCFWLGALDHPFASRASLGASAQASFSSALCVSQRSFPSGSLWLFAAAKNAFPDRDSADPLFSFSSLSGLAPSSDLPLAHRPFVQRLFASIRLETPDPLNTLSLALNSPREKLISLFSPEQLDAVFLALRAFGSGQGFILADETGQGKGRAIMALASVFCSQGRSCVIFTEKRHLFSDLWRDALQCGLDVHFPDPLLLHAKGKIFGPDGTLLFKAPTPGALKKRQEQKQAFSLALTCYSQFNRMAADERLEFLLRHVENSGLLILDESHNAAGHSNTRKHLSTLTARASNVLFSSATFAKHEDALLFYSRALPMSPKETKTLTEALREDSSSSLASGLSSQLAARGYLIRREHPAISPPENSFIELSGADKDFAQNAEKTLASALEALFELHEASRGPKESAGMETEAAWFKLGAPLARLCRQFFLLLKIKAACAMAQDSLRQGRKPVLALESTFESFFSSLGEAPLSGSEELSGEEAPKPLDNSLEPFFPLLFSKAIDQIAPPVWAASVRDSIFQMALARARAKAAQLPRLLASPIDALLSGLREAGAKAGEISGRSTRLLFEQDAWRLSALPPVSRESVVAQFNAGALDCLILTRAGSSGISLHSDASFADTRGRDMIELEILSNPVERAQFLGRVRRRNQLSEPRYFTLATGAPFERRLFERLDAKLRKLSGFTSGSSASQISFSEDLLSPEGDRAAREWLLMNPLLARRLGIDLWSQSLLSADGLDGACALLLRRMPLLPTGEQDKAMDFLFSSLAASLPSSSRRKRGLEAVSNGFTLAQRQLFWGIPAPERGAFAPALFLDSWARLSSADAFGAQNAQALFEQSTALMEQTFPESLETALSGAAHSRRDLISHPLRGPEWQFLRSFAKNARPGAWVSFFDPASAQIKTGAIAAISPPPSDRMLALCQWRVNFVLPGERALFSSDLASLFHHGHFSFLPQPSDFESLGFKVFDSRPAETLSSSFPALSGHAAYLRWWQSKTGFGKLRRVPLSGFSFCEALILPFMPPEGVASWAAFPIALLDWNLAFEALRFFPRKSLSSSPFPQKAPLRLSAAAGGWLLSSSQACENSGFFDYALSAKLAAPKFDPASARFARPISATGLKSVLASLQQRGICFFLPFSPEASHWHQLALARHFSASSGAGKRSGSKRKPSSIP